MFCLCSLGSAFPLDWLRCLSAPSDKNAPMRSEVVVSLFVDSIGGGGVALLVCRVVVGAFFAISGAHKLISPTRHQALFETLKASRIPYLKVMSWFVPGVELSAGLGVAFGFLAPLAAL